MSEVTKDVRLIKRYGNRKLYDTFSHRYITLDELAQIIKEGFNIKVITSKDSSDITRATIIATAAKTIKTEEFVGLIINQLKNNEEDFINVSLAEEIFLKPTIE